MPFSSVECLDRVGVDRGLVSAKSSIGSLSPCNLIPGRTIFAVLKAYFDGSATGEQFLTLACLAATDDVWKRLERGWEDVRINRGSPSSMHMADAMFLEGEFKEWAEEKRDYLVDGFLNVLEGVRADPHLHSFTCTVNIKAHQRWKHVKRHPTPARLCARIVFPHVLDWYVGLDEPILELVELYFDRNEPFMRHIDADWNSKTIRKRFPAWEWVRMIRPVASAETPALQMADMIAWGRNRLTVAFSQSEKPWRTDELYAVAVRAAGTVHGVHRPIDERALELATFPEEGFEAIDRQKKKQQQSRFFRSAVIKV